MLSSHVPSSHVPSSHVPSSRLRALALLFCCAALASVTLAAAGGAHHRGTKRPDTITRVLAAARSHLGATYVWGGTGGRGYDCSGLTSTIWRSAGHIRGVPRTAAQQQAWTVPVPAWQVARGDLVFFGSPVTHVGLVIGREHGKLRMIDASSSHHKVVLRDVWTTGVVRFGRVPRPHMRPVRHAPALRAVHRRSPARPTGPLVRPGSPGLAGRAPIVGLPRTQAHPSSPAMRRFAGLVRRQVGSRTWTDTSLVTALWRRSGGRATTDLRRATRVVPLRDARVGDLLLYGAPFDHVGVYVGGGYLVDASHTLGKVVRRPAWAAPHVTVLRWTR